MKLSKYHQTESRFKPLATKLLVGVIIAGLSAMPAALLVNAILDKSGFGLYNITRYIWLNNIMRK